MNTYFCYNEKYVGDNGKRLCLNCCRKMYQQRGGFDDAGVTLHLQHKLVTDKELNDYDTSTNRCCECAKIIIVFENVSDCDECSGYMFIMEKNNSF